MMYLRMDHQRPPQELYRGTREDQADQEEQIGEV